MPSVLPLNNYLQIDDLTIRFCRSLQFQFIKEMADTIRCKKEEKVKEFRT